MRHILPDEGWWGRSETEACNGARRGSERVYTVRFDQGTGPIDRQAGVSASFDRRAGSAARRSGIDHRISSHDLRRHRSPNPRSSSAGDFRRHQANRSLRRCSGRTARPEPDRRFQGAHPRRARARDSVLGAGARPPPAGDQRRWRHYRRRLACAHPRFRQAGHRTDAAGCRYIGASPARCSRPRAVADDIRGDRRHGGIDAARCNTGLRHGAQFRRLERPARRAGSARRRARGLAFRHSPDHHALGHHRLRRLDPRLRLPLAGDPRARGRSDLRYGALAHRYRAQSWTLRIVGLGLGAWPHFLVPFHVRDSRPAGAGRSLELRRGHGSRPPRRSATL